MLHTMYTIYYIILEIRAGAQSLPECHLNVGQTDHHAAVLRGGSVKVVW